MKATPSTVTKHTNPAVCKAMELLGVLAQEQGETSTKALALRLRVPRTTCYRILRSLIAKDWVRALPGGGHALSLGLLPVLKPLREVDHLAEGVQPILRELALQTGLTAKVSIRQGDFAVTVARCESPQATAIAIRIGAAFHLALGSSGAVLLSGMPRAEVQEILARAPQECWGHQQPKDVLQRVEKIQSQGWCADLGTYTPSCHALSAPLCDGRGDVLASLTIIGFPHELPSSRTAALARLVLKGARQANDDTGRLTEKPRTSRGNRR